MQKLAKTIRDYLLLGTQYGDVQGDHEPVRRDWFRAVFVSAQESFCDHRRKSLVVHAGHVQKDIACECRLAKGKCGHLRRHLRH